ncbi:AraC family transcriptional regulator [Kribbella sp. NPDC026596]|uniref:AraC family transcriptional regulator n=1 Tax=Kribbella sp. NPDC026596 TaxID=3155122 RepID=UPI00340BA630
MAADPLSDVLELIDARCLVSGGFVAGGQWSLRFPKPNRLKLIAIVEGECWLVLDEHPPVRLTPGELAVFDGTRGFVLTSDLELEPVDATELFPADRAPMVQIGSGREVVNLGGHIDLNEVGRELLLDALPPLLHVRADSEEAVVLRWLLDRLAHEVADGRVGSELASGNLVELVFVQVLRTYLTEAQTLPAGWLRALGDDRIAPAVRSMHADPGRAWQLDDLARTASMSRTTFAERFKAVAGEPPLTYLLNWRMRLAQRALRESDEPLSALAHSLGYTSDSAFSTAFKRVNGVAPKRYRDAARAGVLVQSGAGMP